MSRFKPYLYLLIDEKDRVCGWTRKHPGKKAHFVVLGEVDGERIACGVAAERQCAVVSIEMLLEKEPA